MKKTYAMLLAAVMGLALAACAGASDSETSASDVAGQINDGPADGTASKTQDFSMDDIAWSVDEGIIDGERYVLMDYTNNSPYTISNLTISFTEKGAITDEDKDIYYSDLQAAFGFSDEDLSSLKERKISMRAESDKVVAAGESASNIHCYYYGGSFYLRDISHYDFVEPDIATVQYISDGEIYTINYDFKSGKTTLESESVKAYQWTTTALGSLIPHPDVQVLKSGRDDDAIFMFDAYGMTLEQFDAYVEECKALGYTVDVNSSEGFYSADNDEAYNVHLYYNKDHASMSGTVKAPDEAATDESGASESTQTAEPSADTADAEPFAAEEETPDPKATTADGLRADFKEAMDSYEAFFDEYVTFMKKYNESDGSDLSLLTDLAAYMSKYADMMADFEAWDSEDLNTAETAYYIEVQSRINQKLLEVTA